MAESPNGSSKNPGLVEQDTGDAARSADGLALLLRVSEALLSTDDPDEAVGRLARVIVPQLADAGRSLSSFDRCTLVTGVGEVTADRAQQLRQAK